MALLPLSPLGTGDMLWKRKNDIFFVAWWKDSISNLKTLMGPGTAQDNVLG